MNIFKMKIMRFLAFIFTLFLFQPSYAEDSMALTGQISTLGTGLDFTAKIRESLNTTVGYYYADNGAMGTSSFSGLDSFQVTSENSHSVKLTLDWYPFDDSVFKTSAGLMYRKFQANMSIPTYDSADQARSMLGNFVNIVTLGLVGSHTTPNPNGAYNYDVSLSGIYPYLGFGWGNPVKKDGHWGVNLDVGGYYVNGAGLNTSAQFVCGQNTAPATCNTLQNGFNPARVQNDMSAWDWVLSVGVSYGF